MNLSVGEHPIIPITVVRTDRRKTASIQVVEGDVQVIVPSTLSEAGINDLVQKKSKWIRGKLKLQESIKPVRAKEFVSGESFAYLGRNYRLKLLCGDSTGVKLKGGYFVLNIPESTVLSDRGDYIKSQLTQWYLQHADNRLKDKTERYAELLDVVPKSVTIKHYKSRWGGCSVHGDVYYNWRIIMAPHRIVDYVVVHELCHLKHHDHSRQFWSSVGSVIHDYRDCREWLKVHGDEARW